MTQENRTFVLRYYLSCPMIKYIILSLITLYIYNQYIAPLVSPPRPKSDPRQHFGTKDQTNMRPQKPSPGEYVDYEEIKD
jgi:hypothetical protein